MSIFPQQNIALPPSGCRRLSPEMLAARDLADRFEGVAADMAKPFRFLAAFQAAEPYLGLPPQAYKFLAFLVRQTRSCDWQPGSRPIAWPSNGRIQEHLGLSETQVKTLNRILYEAGIFVMRDSPTGKRYGRRAPDGQIIEAYGFDLAPMAQRHDEFIRLAAEAAVERKRMQALRKRVTCARRAIRATGEALQALGPLPAEWDGLAADAAQLAAAASKAGRSDRLAGIAERLEGRQTQAEVWLRDAVPAVDNSESRPVSSVETDPEGSENRPHIITTNPPSYPSDTVRASEDSSRVEAASPPLPAPVSKATKLQDGVKVAPPQHAEEPLYARELLLLAPRLAHHVEGDFPSWEDAVAAAKHHLTRELGVSPQLWGEACKLLGVQLATVALAIVSTKPREHFTRGAGGYFAAMLKRFKTGELHLERSLWKLRRDRVGTAATTRQRPAW